MAIFGEGGPHWGILLSKNTILSRDTCHLAISCNSFPVPPWRLATTEEDLCPGSTAGSEAGPEPTPAMMCMDGATESGKSGTRVASSGLLCRGRQ